MKHRILLVLAGLVLCGPGLFLGTRAVRGDDQKATTQPAAPWASSPLAKWPQLVLTNEASFTGHTALKGASSFLMRMPDGEVVVGTAKHLTREAGGVTPPIPMSEFDKAMQSWRVYPRTKSDVGVEAKGLAMTSNRETSHDWLLLHLADARAKLPATALTPRARPAEVGETIYLIGVPYDDRGSAQNVYKGVVVERPSKGFFKYEFTPPAHISGFSGAPIVDANGLLLGHGVSKFKLKQQDGLEVEFGGEDVAVALALWKHRADPPPVDPASAIHVTLPPGWVPKTSKVPRVLAFGSYPDLVAFFEVIADPTSALDDSVDLMGWAKLVKANVAKTSILTNRQETELKAGKIGARPIVEYEVTGAIKGTDVHYHLIMLELNGCYCKVACWTTPAHWSAAQAKFEEVVNDLN